MSAIPDGLLGVFNNNFTNCRETEVLLHERGELSKLELF